MGCWIATSIDVKKAASTDGVKSTALSLTLLHMKDCCSHGARLKLLRPGALAPLHAQRPAVVCLGCVPGGTVPDEAMGAKRKSGGGASSNKSQKKVELPSISPDSLAMPHIRLFETWLCLVCHQPAPQPKDCQRWGARTKGKHVERLQPGCGSEQDALGQGACRPTIDAGGGAVKSG